MRRRDGKARVLFFHQVGWRGGASVALANVIAALDRRLIEPIVVCPAGDVVPLFEGVGAEVRVAPRTLYQFVHISGFTKPAVHPRFLHDTYRLLNDLPFWREYVAEVEADIVHLNSVTLAPLASAARASGARVLCFVQETMVRGLAGVRTAWLRHLLSTKMDAVVFLSEYDRQAAKCRAPIVEVIPNWVDFRVFDRTVSQALARRTLGLPGDAKVVLFMGGINRIKGTIVLLQASEVLKELDDLVLLVAGYSDAPAVTALSLPQQWHSRIRLIAGLDYRQRVLNFVSSHAMENRVRFLGMTDDVVPLYAAADVVVFPAVEPHQARPVLEAGAMAKPVVVSDFSNLYEFVVHGETGLTVPPGSAPELARALRQLLAEPALARRLGEGNYALASRVHNRELSAPRFAGMFERLCVER